MNIVQDKIPAIFSCNVDTEVASLAKVFDELIESDSSNPYPCRNVMIPKNCKLLFRGCN